MCGRLRALVMDKMLVRPSQSSSAPEVYKELEEIFSVMESGGSLQHLL